MERSLQVMRSPKRISEQPDSSSRAIREFLAKAGEVYSKQITAPLVAIWLEHLGSYRVEQLEPLFRLAFATWKFFPTPADVLEPLKKTEEAHVPLEAEQKWQQVLNYAQTTSPDYPARPIRIKEQTQAAIRAAGGLNWIRDCSRDDLQWAKKRFVEAYTSWNALEKNQFLLPDGKLKELLTGTAEQKLLPSSGSYEDAHARGLAYAKELKESECEQPDSKKRAIRAVARELAPRPPMRSLEEQKRILRVRGLLPKQESAEVLT